MTNLNCVALKCHQFGFGNVLGYAGKYMTLV